MTSLHILIAAYFACDAAAQDRLLSLAEVDACRAVYADVKTAFLDEAERARLDQGPAARHAALLQGYHRLRDWIDANPEAVRHLRGWPAPGTLK